MTKKKSFILNRLFSFVEQRTKHKKDINDCYPSVGIRRSFLSCEKEATDAFVCYLLHIVDFEAFHLIPARSFFFVCFVSSFVIFVFGANQRGENHVKKKKSDDGNPRLDNTTSPPKNVDEKNRQR